MQSPALNRDGFNQEGLHRPARVFVPYSEDLQKSAGVLGDLVPFDGAYWCLRLLDGSTVNSSTANGSIPR
ncbi:MAG: hypothetical protein ACI9ON_004255 [Limisphaerales bacterium]|jgi:hypothetical protein